MSDSDDKIKQISKLLELGGTMLAQHCTTCGAPMFRYHGDVLCPICQGEGVGTSMPSQVSTVPQNIPVQETTTFSNPAGQFPADRVSTTPVKQVEVTGSVSDMLKMKLESIAGLIHSENDPRRIREYLEIMEKCLDILDRLN